MVNKYLDARKPHTKTVYRASFRDEGGAHVRYMFFQTAQQRDRTVGKYLKEYNDNLLAQARRQLLRGKVTQSDVGEYTAELDTFEVELTPAGVIEALNLYASHADNG